MGTFSSPFQSPLSAMHTHFPVHNEQAGRQNKWEPKLYERNPALQEGLHCASLRDPKRLSGVLADNKVWTTKTALKVSPQEFQHVGKAVDLCDDYTDLIDHHVHFRAALFFQQAVACYNTPFHFEISKTEGQFFEAPGLKVKNSATGAEKNIRYEAAHSGTIPGLKACLRSERQPGQTPHYFTYLKDSHMEVMHNSTNGLPDFVNKIDTLIDGKAETQDGLRKSTIALINRVALGALTPTEATKEFLANFEHSLIERPKRSKSLTPAKRKVIELYKTAVQQMRIQAGQTLQTQGVHPFFDFLLNVNVSKEAQEDAAQIRKIVYRRKYELIRESLFTESKIQMQIDQRFPAVKDPEQRHLLRCALVYFVRTDAPLCRKLEKLFCVSLDGFRQNPALIQQLNHYANVNLNLFNLMTRDIRATLREYTRLENAFQAMLIRDLRTQLRNWNQTDLSATITNVIAQKVLKQQNKAQPNIGKIRALQAIPRSQSTISRLENSRIHIQKNFKTPENQRRKPLTMHYAKVLSKALGVEHGHFFSSFFASEEG
jgi:hypothetical protein